MRVANTYQEACAIMRMVEYGERSHRSALRLQKRAIVRNDSRALRDKVKADSGRASWVGGGIPVRLIDGEL